MRTFISLSCLLVTTIGVACSDNPGSAPRVSDAGDARVSMDAGAEGGGPGGARTCVRGIDPIDISGAEEAPKALLSDGTSMYWLTSASGKFALRRAPMAGGTPPESLLETSDVIASMALAQGRFVLASAGKGGEVFTFDPGTKERKRLAKSPEGVELDAFGVAADDTYAYVIGHETQQIAEVLLRVPLSGGEMVQLARIKLSFDQDVKGLVLDETYAYWATASGYIMRSARVEGSKVETVVDDVNGLSAFALGPEHIFYLAASEHTAVVRVPKAGGTPLTLAEHTGARFGLAVGSDSLVYASSNDYLHRIGFDGADDRVITSGGVVSCGSIHIEGAEVFFANTATAAAGGSVRATCMR